jgi:hypothetical protein
MVSGGTVPVPIVNCVEDEGYRTTSRVQLDMTKLPSKMFQLVFVPSPRWLWHTLPTSRNSGQSQLWEARVSDPDCLGLTLVRPRIEEPSQKETHCSLR